MPTPTRRVPDGALAAAVVLGTFLVQLPFRMHWVSLVDEGAILQDAVDILAGRRMYVDAIHPAFPGVFYLTAAAFALAGTTLETARALACLVFAVTVGLAWTIARWWLRPLGALAVVALFVAYRVWAFPHWHMVSYSSLAVTLLLAATVLVGRAYASGGREPYALAGAVAGLALLTKQDSGFLGMVGLFVAILIAAPERPRRRLASALWFGAGATIVGAGAVLAMAWAGMLGGLVQHAIVAPLHGLREFDYQGSPPLWPLLAQDAAMRARPFSYFPSILADLYWPAVHASRLYRDTALPDAAMRLAYHGLWLLPLAALPLVARAADDAGRLRRARERLIVVLAAACWLAFNRPHDWVHLLVLYPPALLVLALLVGRLAAGRRARAVGAVVALALVATLAVSSRVALDLRARMSAPAPTPRGTLYATPPQAASLRNLVAGVAETVPPGTPLASLPYHPLVNFVTASPPLTRYYSVWPGEPERGRTRTVIADLEARPDGLVVYNQSQVPYFARLPEYAPDLVAYLADHYDIARRAGGPPLGYEFLLLRREPPPPGRPLLADGGLARARVVVEPAGAPPREATAAERARFVAEAVFPFRRVLHLAPAPGTTVAVRLPVTPGPTTRLRTSYGVDPDVWVLPPAVPRRFTIAVAGPDGETVVADATREPYRTDDDRRWTDVDVDLAPWAGAPIEVILRAGVPAGAPAAPPRAGFGLPRLVE